MSKTKKSATQERLTKESAERAARMGEQKKLALRPRARTKTNLNNPPSASSLCTNRCASLRRVLKRRPASN